MTRKGAIFGTIAFFAVGPVTAAGIVPWFLSGWREEPAFLGLGPLRFVGAAAAAAGVALLVACYARFALDGLGTPAPIAPPSRLVIQGPYRHVRNPIYLAVLGIVLGQAFLLGNVALLAYGGLIFLACHLFVVLYEEPNLQRRFGADYAAFFAAVPRWLPRAKAWAPSEKSRGLE